MPPLLPEDGQRIDDDDDAHLFRPPPPNPRDDARWLKGALAVSALLFLLLTVLGAPLRTEAAPLGIVSFEFPIDVAGAVAMIESLDDDGRAILGLHLGLDMAFLLAYATFFSTALTMLAHAERLSANTRDWARRLGPFAWITAGLDAMENGAIGVILANGAEVDPMVPVAATTFATTKFALFITLSVFVVAGWCGGGLLAPAQPASDDS